MDVGFSRAPPQVCKYELELVYLRFIRGLPFRGLEV